MLVEGCCLENARANERSEKMPTEKVAVVPREVPVCPALRTYKNKLKERSR